MGNRFQIQAVSLHANKCWRNWKRNYWISRRRELPASFWCCVWGFSKGFSFTVLALRCCWLFWRRESSDNVVDILNVEKKCRDGVKWKWWRNQQHLLVLRILAFSHICSNKWLWSSWSWLDFLCISRNRWMQATYISITILMHNDSHLCDSTTVINYGFYILFFM